MAKKKDNLKGGAEEMKTSLVKLQENLRVLRFNVQGTKAKNVKEQAALKKQIARLLTQLNQNK